MRRFAWWALAGLVLVGLPALPAAAAVAAPVLTPADGGVVGTDPVVTAAYTSAAPESRILVTDTTSGRAVFCADEVPFLGDTSVLRCQLRDLVSGHVLRLTANVVDA